LLTRCNPLLRTKVAQAWDAIEAGRVFEVCLHICSNQSALIDRDLRVLQLAVEESKATVFQHHLVELSEQVTRNWAAPTSKPLRFIERELFEHVEQDVEFNLSLKSLIGFVRVAELASFFRDEKTNLLDERLFHANVRGYLGIQNPVNHEIATTLQSSSNNQFFCLNNGITIVCERYLYQSGGFPVTLHRPQIVNGRQTAETLFRVFREESHRTADVAVFVRVVQTSDPSLIEEVSIATNSQSRIGSRDLRANSAIAQKLASGLASLGYYYVRKRGEHSTHPPGRTIDALRAGQLILAYLRGFPEKAKTDTTSMFGEQFETVFDPHQITPELLVTAHKLFLDIESEKHRAMLTMRQSGLSAASAEHWLVEGAFHVLYCVGLLARSKDLNLESYEGCSGLVGDAMHAVGRYYESVNRIAAYRLFRSVRARDDLKQMLAAGVDLSLPSVRQLRFDF
jgi:hypothetical protein